MVIKYMMKEMKYKIWICILIVLLAIVCSTLYYVAFMKTDFSKHMIAILTHEPYMPKRSDNCCIDSWNNCIRKLEIEVDVVFLGDSHTAGGNFQKAFPHVKSINLGYIGEDTKGMLRRVESVAVVRPKKIFLMTGINGLKNQSLLDFEFWYAALVDSIHTAVPQATLYVESILPVTASSNYCDNIKIREANDIIKNIAAVRQFVYIDLHEAYAMDGALPMEMSYDGLHLTSEAYNIWYNTIREYI